MKRLLIVMLCWMAGGPVAAFQFQYGKTVTINEPVYKDLYITGGNIIINAPVHGDLVVAGGTININDSVTNDILVAGGTVTFNGYVGDDIRCAGGDLQVLRNVAGDVVITGGTITINKGITIGGLIASGGEITIDGLVAGDVKCFAGTLLLNGVAMKALDCRGGKITINGKVEGPAILSASDKISIGNEAAFGSTVRYWALGQVNFKQSLKAGEAIYDPSLKIKYDRWYYLGFASLMGLLWYAGMVLLLIMLVQYLFSATMKKAGETAYNTVLKSLGYGLLFWIGVPVAAVVAFVTIIGVPVGLLLLFSYIILILLATVITAVVAANWLNSRSNTNWNYRRLVLVAFGIFVLLKIITFTPFFGWFIIIVLTCIMFGAILLNINWRRRQPVIS